MRPTFAGTAVAATLSACLIGGAGTAEAGDYYRRGGQHGVYYGRIGYSSYGHSHRPRYVSYAAHHYARPRPYRYAHPTTYVVPVRYGRSCYTGYYTPRPYASYHYAPRYYGGHEYAPRYYASHHYAPVRHYSPYRYGYSSGHYARGGRGFSVHLGRHGHHRYGGFSVSFGR